MLDKPKYGWCNIYVGHNKIGCASYLIDLPVYLLDVFNQYFSADNKLNFGVEFDAEVYDFGLIEFDETLYSVNNKTTYEIFRIKKIEEYGSGEDTYTSAKNILKILAKELVNDIETNFEEWVYWQDDGESQKIFKNKD